MPDLPTLWQAVSAGDISSTQLLLGNGADINSIDDQSGTAYTALHYASAQGQNAVVRLLLQHNADANIFGLDGMTALHLAVQNGHAELVQALLEHGIEVNQQAQYDRLTPLHLAAKAGNRTVLRVLLCHGADVSAVDVVGNTALHFSANNGDFDVTAILIAFGADAHARNEVQESPLHVAGSWGNERVVRFLVEHDVDPWTGNAFGGTPLEYAIREGHENVVRELLSQDRFPIPQRHGESALVAAAGSWQSTIVELLLHMGYDANSSKVFSQPHRVPMMRGQFTTIAELGQQFELCSGLQGPWSALHAAVYCCNQVISRVLLDNGANPDSVDACGWTPLHSAASKGLNMVSLLFEYGADANIRDTQGCIPLHWAVVGSVVRAQAGGWSLQGRNTTAQQEAILHLLRYTSDINTQNNDGQTALHWAVRYGDRTIVGQLIEQDANPMVTDVHGRTPLDWAIECDRRDLLDMLA
ncbi:hypothetical protein CNMCM5623_002469 [Aspergillus felis]|uniref:Ankyrin repeat protein n=1 Tax=Aspergillus felis TaxID=1287682 RepID=A0A8H6UWQ7_9EURO|nr:hypothetical protein CNMCM5623_002469 [Aspergillus felis]